MYKQVDKLLNAYEKKLRVQYNITDVEKYIDTRLVLATLMKAGITTITNDVIWNYICKRAYCPSPHTESGYAKIDPAQAFYKVVCNQRTQIWFDKRGLHKIPGLNYKIILEVDNISKYHFGLNVKNDMINYIFEKRAYVTIVTPHNTYYIGAIKNNDSLIPYHNKKRWEEDTEFWEKYNYEDTQFDSSYSYCRDIAKLKEDTEHHYVIHPTRVTKNGTKGFVKTFPVDFYTKIEILKDRASRYGIDISFIPDGTFTDVNSTLFRKSKKYSNVYLQKSYKEKWLTRPEFSEIDIQRIEDCYQSLQFFENLCNEGHDLVAEGFLCSEDFATCPCCGHPVRLVKEVKNLTYEEYQQFITLVDTECDRCGTLIEAVR